MANIISLINTLMIVTPFLKLSFTKWLPKKRIGKYPRIGKMSISLTSVSKHHQTNIHLG
jgi:hypothetical protein